MAKFNLQEYIQNNRQQAMLAGGGIALALVLLLWGVIRMLSGGESDEMADASAGAPFGPPGVSPSMPPGVGGPGMPTNYPGMPPQPGMPTPSGMPSQSGMPPQPGMPPGPMPGGPMPDGGAATPADNPNRQGAAPAAAKKTKQPSLFVARAEPFAPLPPKGNPAELERRLRVAEAQAREQQQLAQLAQLPPMDIYRPPAGSGGIGPDGGPVGTGPDGTGTPEIPVQRRVSGVMWGDRVAAVLESDGKGDVVRPGDVISSGGKRARVTRIDRDAVILRTEDKKIIRVPIAAAPAGTAGAPAAGPGGGYPGMPYPGGSPYPGGPPRMPRGPQPLLPEG